jgi:hypothetical protein
MKKFDLRKWLQEQRDISKKTRDIKPKRPIKPPIKDPKRRDPGSDPVGKLGKGKITDPIDTPLDPINGCTDPSAINYNPEATNDDGSCTYPVEGCTDPDAINYNPDALLDDDSCRFFECQMCTTKKLSTFSGTATLTNHYSYWAPTDPSIIENYGLQSWTGTGCPPTPITGMPYLYQAFISLQGHSCQNSWGWFSGGCFKSCHTNSEGNPCGIGNENIPDSCGGANPAGCTGGPINGPDEQWKVWEWHHQIHIQYSGMYPWTEGLSYPGYEQWEELDQLCTQYGLNGNGDPIN